MRLVLGLLIAVFAGSSSLQPGETDEILAQLSKTRLDKKQFLGIRDITIRRDSVSVSFKRGTIGFLEPVMGRVTGAVFIGSGEIVAIPPDAVEKQQIHKFIDSPILNEPFSAAFFRFTDNTYEEILNSYREHAAEDFTDDNTSAFAEWDNVIAARSESLNYRLLADYLETPRPLFLAEINGQHNGWFNVIFDQRRDEEVSILKIRDQGTESRVDIWSSFNRREDRQDLAAAAKKNKYPVGILSYTIDATLPSPTRVEAQTTVVVRSRLDHARVISFELPHQLRVSAATLESGVPVRLLQAGETIAVVLPEGTVVGRDFTLKFAYAGDVSVNSIWYPTNGGVDWAKFNVTFHFPPKFSLVSNGTKVAETEDRGMRHSTWKTDSEVSGIRFRLDDSGVSHDETAAQQSVAFLSSKFGASDLPLPGLSDAEIVREWFTSRFGWSTYRDQWISEGLSAYVAALAAEQKPASGSSVRALLNQSRGRLLSPVGAGNTFESLGPLWIGPRLNTATVPNGYMIVTPAKAAWVIHMLRMMMRSGGDNADQEFTSAIKDFLTQFHRKNASTWDFKKVLEAHMTKSMDVRGDRKLDWFFDDWVMGTGIPAYAIEYNIRPAASGFVIEGHIVQSGVPDDFSMPVPLYADDQLLGRVIVSSDEGKFRFTVQKRPGKVTVDPEDTILKQP